jgi:hypothetical protein
MASGEGKEEQLLASSSSLKARTTAKATAKANTGILRFALG